MANISENRKSLEKLPDEWKEKEVSIKNFYAAEGAKQKTIPLEKLDNIDVFWV